MPNFRPGSSEPRTNTAMLYRGDNVLFEKATPFCYIDPRLDGPWRSPRDGESMMIRAGTVGVFADHLKWVSGLLVLTVCAEESDWCSVRLGLRKYYHVDLPVCHVTLAFPGTKATPLARCLDVVPEWFRDDR